MFTFFFVYNQNQDFRKIRKLIQDIKFNQLFSDSGRKYLIKENIKEIEQMLDYIKTPEIVIVLLVFLYKENVLFSLDKKKQTLKRMALLFKSTSTIVRRVCLLDYYTHFIRIFKIKEKRRKRFLYRKSLPFSYQNEVKEKIFMIKPIEFFIPQKVIKKIGRIRADFAAQVQKFRDKLQANQRITSSNAAFE